MARGSRAKARAPRGEALVSRVPEMAMEEVGAEAIVFLDYSKDFPHMQQGGIIGWQSSAVVSQAVLAGAKSFANMARSFALLPALYTLV